MTKPKALAQFMLEQFKSVENARTWMLRWSFTLERIGEPARAWHYRQAITSLRDVK